MKILVVDDEPIFLELIVKYLRALGYQDTHSVTSAFDALEALQTGVTPFDCCLLDIRMPGMDGIELCRNIRTLPDYLATPIVMITSMTEKSYVDDAFRAGANDYVTKPIDRMEIAARMGMVEALVAERANSGHLLRQLDDASSEKYGQIVFEDPVMLEDAGGVIALSSMENYLLRLGKLRLYSCAAIGFHVENAELILAQTGGLEFMDILSEVALAIQDGLVDTNFLLTYAGCGDFCCVQSQFTRIEPSDLEILINDRISQRLNVLSGTGLAMPVVRVGQPQSSTLVSFNDPTYLIYASIDDVRGGSKNRELATDIRDAEHRHAG